jgi:hypothetical protein
LFFTISEENGCSKFFLRFLGSVEVNYHKGDEILCQAINKVLFNFSDKVDQCLSDYNIVEKSEKIH